jgi:hypothetical protein
MKKVLLALVIFFLFSCVTHAQTLLGGWTFPSATAATSYSSDQGLYSGNLYLDGTNGSSTWTTSTPTEIQSNSGVSTNDPRQTTNASNDLTLTATTGFPENNKSFVLKISTIGYSNLTLSYATKYSSTSGFTSQQWAYSTDGISFTNTTLITVSSSTYSLKSVDLTAVTALNNVTNIYLKCTVSGASGSGTNNRFDNFTLKSNSATWIGGTSTTYTIASNWLQTSLSSSSYGAAPTSTSDIVFTGSPTNSPSIGSTATTINSATYLSGASGITFGGSGILTIKAGITNNSTSNETFNTPITLSTANQSFSGKITVANNITLSTFTLTIPSTSIFDLQANKISGSVGSAVTINGTFKTSNAAGFSGSSSTAIDNTNSPTVTLGASSTVDYSAATGTQTISARADYANVTLSNAGSSKSLSGNATIAGILNLTGTIALGNNTLTISSSGSINGASSSNYVITDLIGSLKMNVPSTNTNVTFPIGTSTRFNQIILNNNGGTADNYSVKVSSGAPANTPNSSNAYIQNTWTIAESVNGGSNLTLTTQWNASSLNTQDEGSTYSHTSTKIGRYTGTGTTYESYAATVSGSNPYTALQSAGTFTTVGTSGASFVTGNIVNVATEPTTQSAITFGAVTNNSVVVNFSGGDGAKRIVVARTASDPSSNGGAPVDATSYTDNANFGSGTQIGTSNYVVYAGTGNTVTVTGLSTATTYYFAVYEYNDNNTSSQENYLTTSPGLGNKITFSAEPTSQPSGLSFTSVTATGMTINWSGNGDGNKRIVLVKSGSAVDADPLDGTTYTANTVFGSGTQIGTGNRVVYANNGSSVVVTGMLAATTYHVAVYEFNGSGGSENYLLTAPLTGNQATSSAAAATVTTTAISAVTVSAANSGGNVTSDGGDALSERGIVYGTSSDPTTGDTKVVDVAATTGSYSSSLTSLSANTTYHVRAYAINGQGTSYGSDVSFTTLAAEPTAASSVTFGARTDASLVVNFSGGDGTRRIVVARSASAVNFTPTDGTLPSINTDFSAASDQGSGNKVVYDGTGGTVTVTGLTKNTTYHFAVYEYNNNSATSPNFYATAGTGNQATYNPTISATGTLSFGAIVTGSSSGSQSYNVSGTELVSSITISRPSALFEISLDDVDYSQTSLTLVRNGSDAVPSTTIYVRFSPSSADGTHSGNVTNTATNAIQKDVAVNGIAVAAEPTTIGSISFSNVGTTSLEVNLPTVGDGSNQIIVVKQGGAPTAPSDGTSYTANAVYGSGNTTAAGSYVVYKGSGAGSPKVTVTGLTQNTSYTFTVYELNGSGGSENYLTSSSASASQTTTDATLSSDYFRSAATGNWSANATWQSSHDGSTNWITATATPDNNANTITINSHTITVTASVSIDQATVSSGGTIIVNSGQTLTINDGSGTDLTIDGTVQLAGSFASGASSTITVNGTFENQVNSASFSAGSGTMTIAGGGIFKENGYTGGAVISFTNVSFTTGQGVSGGYLYIALGPLRIPTSNAGNVTWNTTGTGGSFLNGNTTITGNLTVINTSGINNGSGGTARTLTISGNLDIQGGEYDVQASPGGSGGNQITTVNGNVTISGGKLYASSGSASGGSGTLNIKGNLSHSAGEIGVSSSGSPSGSLVFNGSSAQAISTIGFSNSIPVTVSNSAGVTLNSDLSLSGTLALSAGGLIVAANKTLTNGSTCTFTSSGTLTIAGTLINTGTLTVTSGTITVNNGGTFVHNATTGISTPLNNTTLSTGSTFIYRGSSVLNSTISIAGKTFYNLTIESTSGAWAPTLNGSTTLTINGNLSVGGTGGGTFNSGTGFSGAITVAGNVSIASGSTMAFAGDCNVGGNWNNAGTFTQTAGKTLTFNGSGLQTYTRTGTSTVDKLTLSNSGGLSLNNDLTVNTTLSFTAGKITTSSNSVIIGTSGSISGAGTGWVIGNLAKQTANNGSPTFTYPIGSSSSAYTPVTVTFTGNNTSGSTGTLTAYTTGSEHPSIASSGINSLKSVNRYWTLSNNGITGFTSYSPAFTYITGTGDNDAGTTAGNYKIKLYSSSSWSNATVSGTPSLTTATATGVTTFGDFAIGENNNPPTFDNGSPQTLSVCQDASATSINSLLTATDADAGQTLTWTVTSAPSHGSIGGGGATASSGTNVTPSGITYTPTASYSGSDAFTIQVSDGAATATTIINVTVSPNTVGGSIAGSATVCSNSNSGTLTLSGHTGTITKWQYSNDNFGSDIHDIANTTTSQNYSGLTETTYYRALVQSGVCSSALSAVATITVNTAINISAHPATATICSGATSFSVTASGTSPSYQWQLSTDNGSNYNDLSNGGVYSTVTSNTLNISDVAGLNNNRYRVVVSGTSPCGNVTSNAAILMVGNTWTGATNSDWNTSGNWQCGSVPTSSDNVFIPNVTTKPVLSGNIIIGNIMINTGSTLDIGAGNTLTISGAVSGSGTISASSTSNLVLTAAAGTLNFTPGSNTLQNLTLNSSATATIGSALNIVGGASFGTVTVNSGATLTTGGNLTLKSDIDGTARVASLSTGVVTGNLTAERFLGENTPKKAWRLLSSPIEGTTIRQAWQDNGGSNSGYGTLITGTGTGFDGGNASIKTWNGTAWVTNQLTRTDTADIASMQGYMVFVRGDRSVTTGVNQTATNTTVRPTGTLRQGDKSNYVTVPNTAGFTLMGNPYASAIDFEAIHADNTSLVNFYAWDPNQSGTYGVGAYNLIERTGAATYDVTPQGSSNSNNNSARYIPQGVAVFLQNPSGAPSPVTLTMKESYKTANTTTINYLRTTGVGDMNMAINLSTTASQIIDGVRVRYDVTYSNAFTAADAGKLYNNNENIVINRSNQFLIVEKRAAITQNDTVFLRLTGMKQQGYQLIFYPANFSGVSQAYLEDSYLNTSTPISVTNNTTVTFTVDANATSTGDRFRIVFKPSATLPVTFTAIKAYEKGSSVQVEWSVTNESGIKTYEVERSVNGREFYKIGEVAAKGNSNSSALYGFADVAPLAGSNYYRVKSIAADGVVKYTSVVRVTIGKGDAVVAVYPNPVKGDVVTLQLSNLSKGTYSIRLINNAGQIICNQQLNHGGGSSSEQLVLPPGLSKGNYHLEVSGKNTNIITRIVLQ